MSLSLHSRQVETRGPLLLVHGGAWDIPDAALEAHREGLQAVLEVGTAAVQEETDALAGVTTATRALEAHGAFNAGYGAMLNQDGAAELDAGVMTGPPWTTGPLWPRSAWSTRSGWPAGC